MGGAKLYVFVREVSVHTLYVKKKLFYRKFEFSVDLYKHRWDLLKNRLSWWKKNRTDFDLFLVREWNALLLEHKNIKVFGKHIHKF